MTLRNWIKENRELIDTLIEAEAPGSNKNDATREDYVINYERLYNQAREDGVEI